MEEEEEEGGKEEEEGVIANTAEVSLCVFLSRFRCAKSLSELLEDVAIRTMHNKTATRAAMRRSFDTQRGKCVRKVTAAKQEIE